MQHWSYAVAATLTAGLTVAFTSTAQAVPAVRGTQAVQAALAEPSANDRVIRTGTCTAGARWKMKAKEEDGRVEVESEIDSGRAAQRWAWVLLHDGSRSAAGRSVTAGRSGSFSVERTLVDGGGSDTFTFRATHRGQVCLATLRYPA